MARKNSPTIAQEELYPSQEQEYPRADPSDARLLDLDADQGSPFLRAQKRVSVRRGSLPRTTAVRLKWLALGATAIAVAILLASALYNYGEHSWRFRIESSDDIEIAGIHNASRSQIMEVLGGDIGRNIFFIPLSQRKAQLEQIPWVESASVMRFVPNHLRVEIQERTPVAFARIGAHIALMDANGQIMDLPPAAKKKYSFPVILGMNSGEPLSTRAARMKIYNQLVHDLDSEGGNYSRDLSEVDLTDPDDVKVMTADSSGEVLIHLGSSDYLSRYKIFVSHAREWRQQFEKLDSVDLRYDRQIIVNPDLRGVVKDPPLNSAATKAAISAGVKPAALTVHATNKGDAPSITNNRLSSPAASRPKSHWAARHAARARRHHARLAKSDSAQALSVGSQAGSSNAVSSTHTPAAAPIVNATSATGQNAAATTNPSSARSAIRPKPSAAITKDQDHP